MSCGTPAHSLNRVPQAQPHGGSGQPARFGTKLTHRLSSALRYSYQFDRDAIWYPYPVLPLVPTPATASSWGWQLHRRVQLHRYHFYGNVFERRAKLEVSFAVQPQELDGAGCPQRSEGTWVVGAWLFADFLAAESRSAGGPRLAEGAQPSVIRKHDAGRANNTQEKQKFKLNRLQDKVFS